MKYFHKYAIILVVHVAVSYPLYFHTLDHFRRSWQATVISLWDLIPVSILLQRRYTKTYDSVLNVRNALHCIASEVYKT